MSPLSDRQAVILQYIRRFIAVHEFAPTTLEIVEHLRLPAPRAVASDLDALQRKGCIRWTPSLARSIKLPSNTSGPQRLLWDIFNQASEPATEASWKREPAAALAGAY